MSQPGHDAHREMEQRALRNVRGLLDRMEGEEQEERWKLRRFLIVIGVVIAVFALVLAVMIANLKGPGQGKAVVLPPPAGAPK